MQVRTVSHSHPHIHLRAPLPAIPTHPETVLKRVCRLFADMTNQNSSGSNVIVAGTAIFGSDDPNGVIATLKSTVDEAQTKIAQARA